MTHDVTPIHMSLPDLGTSQPPPSKSFHVSTSLATYRWYSPIPASCVLQFMFGLLYANGVFIVLLENPAFTLAIGLAVFSTALGISCAGVLMTRAIPESYYETSPRYVAIVGAIALSSQSLMSFALIHNLPLLLYIAGLLQGFGAGCLYVASVDVLQTWVPEAPGFVTGVGMLCGGAGSLFGIPIYATLAKLAGGVEGALMVAGLLTGGVALFAATKVFRAPKGWGYRPELTAEELKAEQIRLEDELSRLVPPSKPRSMVRDFPMLKVRDVLTDRAFWILLVSFAATVGPGFGFVLGFQSMVTGLFGVDIDRANRLFFMITLCGVCSRFLSGLAVDAFQKVFKKDENDVLTGTKYTAILLLVAQLFAVLLIPVSIRNGNVIAFTAASAVVYATFSGGVVVAACLGRGIFMPNNSSLAFSLSAVSIGFGDMFFSWVIAFCGKITVAKNEERLPIFAHQGDYNLFFFCSLLWSVVGLLASFHIQVSSRISPFDEDRIDHDS